MPNTAKTPGNNDIKIFIKAASSKSAAALLDVLNIRDDVSHDRAVDLVGSLMDVTGDDPSHPLYQVILILTDAIEHYEEKIYSVPSTSPVGILQFLMEQNNLSQSDLADVFGSQSVVSEVLNGKRELNLRHIKKLSEKFGIPPSLLID
jgi:HTH-type transcriptional regulator / antitoxin HigA